MARKSSRQSDLKAIGRRIRALRGAERQADLARTLGITQGQLSRIERGVLGPSITVLLRLRERFGRTVDWVLTAED